MPERIKPPKPLATPETLPEQQETSVPTESEERVLERLHSRTEANGKRKVEPDLPTLETFHTEIEGCECYPLFQEYVSGAIPTLGRMFSNLQPFLDELSEDIRKEEGYVKDGEDGTHLKHLQQMQRLLSGREQQVRGAIQRYVNSVVRFRHLQKLSAGGARDMTEKFVEADHSRRRAHDALIDSLRTYNMIVKDAIRDGYDASSEKFPFVYWKGGEDARSIPANKTPIFADNVLQNRNYIRDWAIVADFRDQLDLLGDEAYLKTLGDRS